LNSQISPGSVATELRPGGRLNSSFIRSLLLNATAKELEKLIYFAKVTKKNKWHVLVVLMYQPQLVKLLAYHKHGQE